MSEQPENDDLSPQPAASAEPGDPNPGGVDAVPKTEDDLNPLPRDTDPSENPATGETVPAVMREGEDTRTQATEGKEAMDGAEESPA